MPGSRPTVRSSRSIRRRSELLVDINIVGVFNTVRAALPSVIDRRGYVLIVSSAAAFGASAGLAPYNTSKAGVEQFASALRLEVAHLGVDVGSAHMLWIDTPLVQDAKSDLPSFRKMLDAMPGPLGKTTSVEACGKAFVKGIERRKRTSTAPTTLRSCVGSSRCCTPGSVRPAH